MMCDGTPILTISFLWRGFLLEVCPAFPSFRRLDSDIGYFLDVPGTGKMTAQAAIDYSKTTFAEGPTALPSFKTQEALAEVLTTISMTTGRLNKAQSV